MTTTTASPDLDLSRLDDVTASDRSPFIGRIKAYAESTLRSSALATDRDGVSAERIVELADLGLLQPIAPAEVGDAAVDRNADRRLHEHLSSGCFNTWLVWAQHAPMLAKLNTIRAKTGSVSPLAARALDGEILLGAGVSDVRRFPDQYIKATRVEGGWRFDGTISWVSGWGLNAALTVAAVDAGTETVVTALVAVGARTIATPLHLAAVGGSRTERVRLDNVFVPDVEVLSLQSLAKSRYEDLGVASDARSHHFGLAHAVLDELDASPHPLAIEIADTWRPRVAQIRADAYGLSDDALLNGGGAWRIDERLATKVASGEALASLTRALVIARSGRGLAGDSTSQLHARSALFVLIQGQTADVRQAQLNRLLADARSRA